MSLEHLKRANSTLKLHSIFPDTTESDNVPTSGHFGRGAKLTGHR